jgi:cell division protein FtsZ
MKFDLPKEHSSIIKVIGVGGGGGNAVNHMYNQGIKDVDFVVCNTDSQQLTISPVPIKIQLGASLTEGRGAGAIPEIGKNAAIENIDELREILSKNTKMVFITAGMGGGTGTGAAPVIARLAKELNILTVGIVTMPFGFEGKKRKEQAEQGLEEMRQAVDTLLVINNERLREMFGNLSLANAFAHADNVLTTAAKGIAEVISVTGIINIDFNDVNTVMKDSGVAIMGQASAEGDDRAIKAVEQALASPLLNDNDIAGARYVLLNIAYGDKEVLMDEISDITDYIQDEAGSTADVIWGHAYDASLGEKLSVTIIATGFHKNMDTGVVKEEVRKVHRLEDMQSTPVTAPLSSPTQSSVSAPVASEEPIPFLLKNNEETEEVSAVVEGAPVSVVSPVMSTPVESAPVVAQEKAEEEKAEAVSMPLFTAEVEETRSESQTTFEFEVKSPFGSSSSEPRAEVKKETEESGRRYTLDSKMDDSSDEMVSDKLSREEQEALNKDRFNRIRDISAKLKTPSGLSDLENEPAYKRRNVTLKDVPHSSESSVSRFTLTEEDDQGEKSTGLRQNNSFLHDNVD